MWWKFYYSETGHRKFLIKKGEESAPLASLSKRAIYFLISYYNISKECLKVVKILPDPLPRFTF